MYAIGKIGVIMPEIIDPLNYELLCGIHDRARALGYDVLVFTGVFNSQLEFKYDAHMIGLENIYHLAPQGKLDGILYAADLFYNAQTKGHIYDLLSTTDTPCLVLGKSSPRLPSLFSAQRESMAMLTRHLIEVHHCRDLYFLSGIPGHYDSEERLAGFCTALQEAGLDWSEAQLFYGNFWREEPHRLAARIAAGELAWPDAVVCANDVMAAALCDGLAAYGIRVPEDIAVTGYDGGWEAYSHDPQITTVSGRYHQFGAQAVDQMHRMLGGTPPPYDDAQQLWIGGSCGCTPSNLDASQNQTPLHRYIRHRTERALVQKRYIAANLVYYMGHAKDMEDFIWRADQQGFVLPGWSWMDICLCQDWRFDLDHPEQYRRQGFSDTMHLALSKRYPRNDRDQFDFPLETLVPALEHPHTPKLVVFTSLHSQEQIFGYVATAYDSTDTVFIDEHYVNWLDSLGNGLGMLQRRMYLEHQKQQMEMLSFHDPATGIFNKKGFLQHAPAFLEACRSAGRLPFLLCLSRAQREDTTEALGIDASLIIANALRLSAGEDEVYGRIDDHVFAVLLSAAPEDDCRNLAEDRILALERKMQYIQGNAATMQMPELVTDNCSLQDEGSSMETVVEEQLARITEKASSPDWLQDYREQLQKLRREIYLAPQRDWSIALVLRRIGISRSHFYRIYKEEFGVSYTVDLIQAKLDKAQQLLRHTDLRIQEIAAQCGYHNENHFMRQFKERFCITPSRYRKSQDGQETP